MASSASFLSSAKIGYARLTGALTATDGSGSPTTLTWVGGAPSTDFMLTQIVVSSTSATGVGDIADSLLHMFMDISGTARLLYSLDMGNPAAGSVTTPAQMWVVPFGPAFIFPSAATLAFGVSVAPTAGNVDVVAFCQAA